MVDQLSDLPIRRLGRTDIRTAALGQGGSNLGGTIHPVTAEQVEATITQGYTLGVRHLDTSPVYGESERNIGHALRRHEFPGQTVSTKVGLHPDRPEKYGAEDVRWSLENSLRLLGRKQVDLALIHEPASMDLVLRPGDGFDALDRMRDEGKCRYIGLGARPLEFHERAIEERRVEVIMTWADYNLVRRTARSLIDRAHAAGVGVILGSPHMQGLLAKGDPLVTRTTRPFPHYTEDDIHLAHEWWLWCRERDVELRHLNTRFVLANPAIDLVLSGAAYASEIETNVREALTPIPVEVWHETLDRLAELDAREPDAGS